MTTNGYKYLTLNLVESLKRAKVPWKLCIVCIDKESAQFLRGQGVDCLVYSELIQRGQTSISVFNTDTFHKITKHKLEIMDQFLQNKDTNAVVYLDGDIVVRKDFMPYLERICKPETYYFQCDENSEVGCSSFENCPNFCTGFIVYRKASLQNLQTPFSVSQALWTTCKQNHDQEYVQRRIRELGLPFQTLDRFEFPNGKMLKHAADPFLRHYNYRIGSSKQSSMKQRGDWFLPY
jgi:lipopolysaccharide biosynthesis glycosyltransferase